MDKQKINKIKTIGGFSIKAGKLKYGIDNITNKSNLVIVSSGLAESSYQKLNKQSSEKKFILKTLQENVFCQIFKEGVKVISIEKCELSNAIYQLMEEI